MSSKLPVLMIAATVIGGLSLAQATFQRSIVILPLLPAPEFDAALAAGAKADLERLLRNDSRNQVLEVPAEAAAAAVPTEVARRTGARFVYSATIENDFDDVTLKWSLYDVLADTAVGHGVIRGDLDNMEGLPREMAAQFDLALKEPPAEEALCRAGNRRLEAVLRPGGGADNVPLEARMPARTNADKALEQLGDRQYDACLGFLDAAFQLLGMPAGYANAAKRAM